MSILTDELLMVAEAVNVLSGRPMSDLEAEMQDAVIEGRNIRFREDDYYAIVMNDGTVRCMLIPGYIPLYDYVRGRPFKVLTVQDEIGKWPDDKDLVDTYHKITVSDFPKDKYFRMCWKFNGAVVAVDIPKARVQRMNEIRKIRNKALLALDGAYFKALESNDVAALSDIALTKQALRDIPQTYTMEDLMTENDIKNFVPSELEGLE